MAHTMEYQELLKRFDKLEIGFDQFETRFNQFETRFDKFEARYATKEFVRAEIKSLETRMIQWFIGTAIALTLAMLGIQNLL